LNELSPNAPLFGQFWAIEEAVQVFAYFIPRHKKWVGQNVEHL
jgi:hypothetical protein